MSEFVLYYYYYYWSRIHSPNGLSSNNFVAWKLQDIVSLFCLTLIASYKFSCPFCCCIIINRKVYSVSAIPDGREERWMDIFGKCWTVGVVLQRYTIPMILSQLLSIVVFRCVNTLFRVVDSSSNRPLFSYRYLKV